MFSKDNVNGSLLAWSHHSEFTNRAIMNIKYVPVWIYPRILSVCWNCRLRDTYHKLPTVCLVCILLFAAHTHGSHKSRQICLTWFPRHSPSSSPSIAVIPCTLLGFLPNACCRNPDVCAVEWSCLAHFERVYLGFTRALTFVTSLTLCWNGPLLKFHQFGCVLFYLIGIAFAQVPF